MPRLPYFLAVFVLAALSLQAADTWDDGYRSYQDVAPEYLEIKVIKVTLKDGGSMFASNSRVELQAEVTQVFRSSTGLQQGKVINIDYTRKSEAGPATLQPSIPNDGQVVPAFLRKKGNAYEPAALHHSFEALTSQQLIALNQNSAAKAPAKPTRVAENKAEAKVEAKVETKKPEKEPVKTQAPPQMIVTAPQPEPESLPVIEVKAQATPEPTPLPTPTPTAVPTPAPKKSKEKKPKVTQPIIVTDSDKPAPTPEPEVPVIVDSLPARKVEEKPVLIPSPSPTAKAAPITIETPLVKPEPIQIKPVEPEPVVVAVPTPTPTPKAVQRPAPALLTSSESPAATAPPAPSSSPFDQEGLSSYAAIYAKIKEGDKASENKQGETALKIYRETLLDLERLRANKPDFQPFIVEYRQKDLNRKIALLEAEAKK